MTTHTLIICILLWVYSGWTGLAIWVLQAYIKDIEITISDWRKLFVLFSICGFAAFIMSLMNIRRFLLKK